MGRAVSVYQLYSKKRKLIKLVGELLELIGAFERCGNWIVWGDSGSGKTSFVSQLTKALALIEKLVYDSMEEGDSETMKIAWKRVKMEEVKRRILLLDNESIEELCQRLDRPKSAKIIIIDSAQYADITWAQYLELKKKYAKDRLFIWISHEDGKLPAGNLARKIRYDANVKIRTFGFKAFAISRYGGGKPYTIWEKGASDFWASGLIDESKVMK